MFEYPASMAPPPGPDPDEPWWMGPIVIFCLASPWLLGIGLLLAVFYLCGGSS